MFGDRDNWRCISHSYKEVDVLTSNILLGWNRVLYVRYGDKVGGIFKYVHIALVNTDNHKYIIKDCKFITIFKDSTIYEELASIQDVPSTFEFDDSIKEYKIESSTDDNTTYLVDKNTRRELEFDENKNNYFFEIQNMSFVSIYFIRIDWKLTHYDIAMVLNKTRNEDVKNKYKIIDKMDIDSLPNFKYDKPGYKNYTVRFGNKRPNSHLLLIKELTIIHRDGKMCG